MFGRHASRSRLASSVMVCSGHKPHGLYSSVVYECPRQPRRSTLAYAGSVCIEKKPRGRPKKSSNPISAIIETDKKACDSKIGIAGCGSMGLPMLQTLLANSIDAKGYDIRPTAIVPDKGEKPGEGAITRKKKEAKYKGLYIYPTDLEEFGYTEVCRGCDRVKEGVNSKGRSRKHDEECRRRIIQELRKKKPEYKRLKKLDENTMELTNFEEKEGMKDKEEIELFGDFEDDDGT